MSGRLFYQCMLCEVRRAKLKISDDLGIGLAISKAEGNAVCNHLAASSVESLLEQVSRFWDEVDLSPAEFGGSEDVHSEQEIGQDSIRRERLWDYLTEGLLSEEQIEQLIVLTRRVNSLSDNQQWIKMKKLASVISGPAFS